MNKYEIIGIVGEGAYGVVYKAKCKETGEFGIQKPITSSSGHQEVQRKWWRRNGQKNNNARGENAANAEVQEHRDFKGGFQTVSQIYNIFSKGRLYLVFEYIEKNLLEVLEENTIGIDPKRLRYFVYQMIKGVTFCHRSNVIHRDIKPENLLINP